MGNQMTFQRYEIKYLLTQRQQEQLLQEWAPYLVPDPFFHSSIRNLYCDTPSDRLIRESLEKPIYKEKIRIRSYGRSSQDSPVFLELKKKYDSIVFKRRITLPLEQALAGIEIPMLLPDSQIGRELRSALEFYRPITPKVFLSYERDSWCGRVDGSFRVTFDRQIRYRTTQMTLDSDPRGTAILPEEQVLMEVKTSGSLPLWMVQTLSRTGIAKVSFSKYGAAYIQMQKGILNYA